MSNDYEDFIGGELPLMAERIQTQQAFDNISKDGDPLDLVTQQVREVLRKTFSSAELEAANQETKTRAARLIRETIERFNDVASSYSRPILAGNIDNTTTKILNSVLGLGPLEPFLADETLEEIMINGAKPPHNVLITGEDGKQALDIDFGSTTALMDLLNRMLAPSGRRIDFSSPFVDAQLSDKSRLHAVIEPIADPPVIITIRRHRIVATTMDDLIRLETVTPQAAEFLEAVIRSSVSMLVAGATASGKTNTINCLSTFFNPMDSILVIEDTRELQFKGKNIRYLTTRPPSPEGKGGVTQADLVKQALRMRPDRIVFGEVRDREAWDMCNAGNTGHDGMLAGVHANSTRDAIDRIKTLSMRAFGDKAPEELVLREAVRAFMLVIYQERDHFTGKRHIREIAEVTGNIEGGNAVVQPLFEWKAGGLQWTGSRPYPRLAKRLERHGYAYEKIFADAKVSDSDSLW